MSKRYIAYYRVSTSKQQKSGLGLEAQRATVRQFTGCLDGSCIEAEYIEAESGKNDNRPILAQALEHSKKTGFTLIIAKLDRLARSVEFIFRLQREGVNFVACDLPDFNTLTLGIFASFAQFERERISSRVKGALAAKVARGLELPKNNNLTPERIKLGNEAKKKKAREDQAVLDVLDIILLMREKGETYRAIADKLNSRGKVTRTGKPWNQTQVMRIEKRYIEENSTASAPAGDSTTGAE